MELDTLGYWSDYEVEVLPRLPATGLDYKFQQERKPPEEPAELVLSIPAEPTDWLALRVRRSPGDSWVGSFQPGVEGISGLFATPSESILCVVVKGQGYWVPVDSPREYEIIPSFPIKHVIPIPNTKMMVFVDHVKLVAYGTKGYLWQTDNLSWDGLKITEVSSNRICGLAWDAPKNQEVEFCVTVANGSYEGGSSPDMYAAGSK